MMSTPPALLTPSPPTITSDPLIKQLSKDPGFRIEIIKVEDSPKVLTFLRRNFFVDEPLNTAIKLIESPEDRCIPLEDFSVVDIHQGLSLMAVGDDGEIMGVLLGACVDRKKKGEEEEDWGLGCEHQKFSKILSFLYQSEKACDVFSFYPGMDRMYDVKILSVDSSCRGKGVGRLLTEKAFALAKASKIDFLKLDCSSGFSSKIADKLGCKENYSIKYSDYKINGEQIFFTEGPHTHFAIKSTKL